MHTDQMSLEFVKAVKNQAKVGGAESTSRIEIRHHNLSIRQVTVNDVLMSAFTGALRRYSKLMMDPLMNGTENLRSRVLLPIAMPRASNAADRSATRRATRSGTSC